MNYLEYKHLIAERATLRSMIDEVPVDAVIDRLSLQARLKKLEAELATVKQAPKPPASVRLTFRGRPVVLGQGVFVEFASKALEAFSKTVLALAASQAGPLPNTAPLRDREQYQLLITGTAIGSFG